MILHRHRIVDHIDAHDTFGAMLRRCSVGGLYPIAACNILCSGTLSIGKYPLFS